MYVIVHNSCYSTIREWQPITFNLMGIPNPIGFKMVSKVFLVVQGKHKVPSGPGFFINVTSRRTSF